MVSVAIFDYGAGNIFSLKTSLEKNGASVDVITSFDQAKNFAGILLPGVGNFDPAIRSIRDYSATQFKDFVQDKIPVLGICLGMEMFFAKSEEGKEKGLDVLNGEVVLLPKEMKIPHMGWNKLESGNSILEGINENVYFVHSYYVPKSKDTMATCNFGSNFSAALQKNNFYGCQFHPEKSGEIGERILKRFIEL